MSITIDFQQLEKIDITAYPSFDFPFFTINARDGGGNRVMLYVNKFDTLDRIRPHIEAINAILSEPVAPTAEPTGADPILETI